MNEMKCPSCGASNLVQIDTNKYQCPYCGKTSSYQEVVMPQQTQQFTSDSDVDDEPKLWMNILCLFIPLVGLIMYFVKKDTQPNCAKSYIKYALIGFAINIIYMIL